MPSIVVDDVTLKMMIVIMMIFIVGERSVVEMMIAIKSGIDEGNELHC